MRRARWKRKNVRRVGLRQRRPPAAGGGRLAVPRGGQRRKRAALGEPFGLGKLGIPSATLPAAAHASSKNSQRQRKKKQLNASTTPTPSAPSATGRQSQKSQKSQACPKAGPNRSRHRYADPRRTEGHCTGVRSSGLFFWTVHGPFSFPQDGKENGGCIPAGQAPCGSRSFCSISAPFHRSHKTTSAAASFCGRHRCHFHRSPWTIPLPDLRCRQRLPCAGIRCPGP